MLTIHTDAHGAAVAVDGDRIVAVGTAAEVTAAHPVARVRQWPGRLAPGRTHSGALPDAPSARERVHALLRTGVTAVGGEQPDPEIRSALARAGLATAAGPKTPPDLSARPLSPGARADFAVFDGATCVATVVAGRLVHRRR